MSELLKRLAEYSKKNIYPFHMPGHKRNTEGTPIENTPLKELYDIDITEISGFDNLHNAEGILKEAEERAAKAYGSNETHFLIDGSTAGILSAVSAVSCEKAGNDIDEAAVKKQALIISRNCHKSVYNAAFLNGLELRYIYPEYDAEYDIYTIIKPNAVKAAIENALSEGLNIVGVVITSPTYEGVVSDIGVISGTVHEYSLPLIVDEAHGAHFGFNTGFPENSVRLGADIVIHSVHKTLPAPTQTALIHLNGNLVTGEALRKYLKIYQSSSPSYVLMAGIDEAVSIAANGGNAYLDRVINYRRRLKKECERLEHIRLCPYTEPGKLLIRAYDTAQMRYVKGKTFFSILRDVHGLELEMASGSSILGILTMCDTDEGADRLIRALKNFDKELTRLLASGDEDNISPFFTDTHFIKAEKCEVVIPFYKAYSLKGIECPLNEAEGKTAVEFINIYPPGSPIVVPGERITGKILSLIDEYIKSGFEVQGIKGGFILTA